MSTKKRDRISLAIVILLAVFVFNLVFPQYLNRGIDWAKPKLAKAPLLRYLPRLPERDFKYGLDLQGGSRLIYRADLSQIGEGGGREAMAGLRDVIERRVNLLGVAEPIVAVEQKAQEQRLRVELAGVHDVSQAIKAIGQTPYLEFKTERSPEQTEQILEDKMGREMTQEELNNACFDGAFLTSFIKAHNQDPCFEPSQLTGRFLKTSTVRFDQQTMQPEVLLNFDDEGNELFEKITEQNIDKKIAIYVDDVLISAPMVQEKIAGGNARITGSFTLEGANTLSRNLNAGALPVPIELISQNTIGPTLGAISVQRSLRAGIFGLLLICLFMLIFYRLPGFLAGISLLIYAGIFLALLKFVPITLTLAGIGGAILSIGMAVDANVLIFERQKEEKEQGESFQKAVESGFSRAWPSIRDGNFTTLLVAVIMFSFGVSFLRGFALTLSLGILVSMFSAMFITRTFMRAFFGTRWEKIKGLWR